MKVGRHNIAQKANGDWTEYRIFNGDRFFFHKHFYSHQKNMIESEKEKLTEKAAKENCRIRFRTTKMADGWSLWFRRLVGRKA